MLSHTLWWHSLVEYRENTDYKNPMASIQALEECRLQCDGVLYTHQLLTDHENFEYLGTY